MMMRGLTFRAKNNRVAQARRKPPQSGTTATFWARAAVLCWHLYWTGRTTCERDFRDPTVLSGFRVIPCAGVCSNRSFRNTR